MAILAAGGVEQPSSAGVSESPFDAGLCLPQQLALDVSSITYQVRNTKTHVTRTLANVNAYAVNVSPLPCFLAGEPDVDVIRGDGMPVRLVFHKVPYATSEYASPGLAGNVLAPKGIEDVNVVWYAPYCGPRSGLRLRIGLAYGSVTSRNTVVPPPCKASGDGSVTIDTWRPDP